MKKILSLLLCAVILSYSATALAETESETSNISETVQTEVIAEESELSKETDIPRTEDSNSLSPLLRNTVSVTAKIKGMPFVKESDAVFELLTADGKTLGTKSCHISPDCKEIKFIFDVPTYELGTSFKVRAVSGVDSVLYYNDTYHTGSEFVLPTYTYVNTNGEQVESTDIAVTITPLYDKSINLYYNGTSVPLDGARVIDGTAMVPIKALAEFIGFNVLYNKDYNVEIVSLNGKEMLFNLDTAYTTIFGTDLFAPHPTIMIDGVVFASLRTFADALGSEIEVKDYFTHLDINLSESTFVAEYFKSLPINSMNVSSRTNYMVWVSLSEYKVRLYEGKINQWKPILEAPCAIGAPGTPTVTGSFEYKYKTRWDYGTYYVGPCLVFYNGYALHSVLLYQNGTEYDGRVGVKISHGCVRLKKNDIDFIANTIPVGTKIYLTP